MFTQVAATQQLQLLFQSSPAQSPSKLIQLSSNSTMVVSLLKVAALRLTTPFSPSATALTQLAKDTTSFKIHGAPVGDPTEATFTSASTQQAGQATAASTRMSTTQMCRQHNEQDEVYRSIFILNTLNF